MSFRILIKNKIRIILIFSALFLFPFFAQATVLDFNIDPSYDYAGRSRVSTFLYQIGVNAYFYVEDDYYQNLDLDKRKEFTESLQNLSKEFDEKIYPDLTEIYGSEWNLGIDNDKKITVLITRIKDDAAGYFNEADEYPKSQSPNSNEKEMIYISTNYITDPLVKSYLAHEFIHLITFNQKTRAYGISEETWLNEARAETASTLLGYDDDYQGSNLQKRARTFSQKPGDSLTEWKDSAADYGALNMFTHYLIEHYGKNILSDSLHYKEIGITSLNYALTKNRYSEDFSQIFTNWLIAVFVNDCSLGQKYCYLNENLKNIRIAPQINYLPLIGESTLSVTSYAKSWAGNWLKFIGGEGTLKFEFIGDQDAKFKVPYLRQGSSGSYSVDYINLDNNKSGIVYVSDFGTKYNSFIIIPSVQHKISGFDGVGNSYKFIWSASIINENSEGKKEEERLINQLLAQIEFLKNEIIKIQVQVSAILGKKETGVSCQRLENNLYPGIQNSDEVRCLQDFLKKQGAGIYPEGLITGNFGTLTRAAVIRFQEKYAFEILTPLGLSRGTGIVGTATRNKINEILNR